MVMTLSFLRKGVSVFALAALVTSLVPQVVFGAYLAVPSHVQIVDGVYTNDTTPTFTWNAPSGATWYEYSIDAGGFSSLGNVLSYTSGSLTSGWHTFHVRAHDNSGNTSLPASVTFEIDVQGPTVPAVSPSSATEGKSVTLSVSPYGESVPTSCVLYVDGASAGSMTKSGSSFIKSYTFSWDGTYTVYARCTDGDGNVTNGTSRTVTVADVDGSDDDEDYPTVPAISPSSADEDEEVTITVEPKEDENGDEVLWCDLYVDGDNVGDMDEDDGQFFLDYTFHNGGSYTVYATCTDEDHDTTRGASRTVRVDDEDDNSDELEVPKVSPSSADEDEETEFTVRPTSDYNVTSCWLYVDGDRVASMDEESTNTFVAEYEFTREGSYSVYAVCKDSSGDEVTGDKTAVRVDDEDDDNEADEGSLIKLSCGASSTVSDPCRAVYYYGEDGKRHAFPNESTFYTWYDDFDDVIEVSSDFMSSISIGENVTYRPGSVLVKFESSSAIYAIEAERTLRQYKTWSLLEEDYGDDAADFIVTLSDSLYSNYDLGSKIDSDSDFDRTDAYYSVDGIEDLF